MRILIYAGIMTLCMTMATFHGLERELAEGEFVVRATLGAAIGMFVTELVFKLIGSKPRRRRQPRTRAKRSPAVEPPRPFRTRLARYAGRDETEVMEETEPVTSKMPFRSSVDRLVRTDPRPGTFFRRLLQRIRSLVRSKA